MVKEYRIIRKKEDSNVELGDIARYDEDLDVYIIEDETVSKDSYFSRRTLVSPEYMYKLYEQNYVVPVEEKKQEIDANVAKLEKLRVFIMDLQNKYEARNKRVNKKYNAGKIPTCLKTEHDTVHFNLMKLLDKFTEMINE